MADALPQVDLPRGITGASDLWDNGAAGAVLSAGYFGSPTPASPLRVWTGTAWVPATLRAWDGSAWVVRPVRHWTGSGWA
jgi:hypothetical protein